MTGRTPRTIDSFEVVGTLGRGGMGVVYEVRQAGSPRRLALKLMLSDEADEAALQRFGREAELLARIRHPNVVRIHELGKALEGPYLVTDLVEGTDLKSLREGGAFDPDRVARIMRCLADAVAALHGAGVLHRDLKPQNVMIRPDGTPVLLDFGLARATDSQRLTRTGTTLGTPGYMAPEQAAGDSSATLSERTDVYGLGAVLFHLLAGRAPFEGATVINIITKLLREEPRWPSEDGNEVPPDLETICRKAMAKERMGRYASAEALRDDLDRFLQGGAIEGRLPSRRAGWLLLGSGVAALLIVAGWAGSRGWRAGPRVGSDSETTASTSPQHPKAKAEAPSRGVARAQRSLTEIARDENPERRHEKLLAWLERHPGHPSRLEAEELLAAVRSQAPAIWVHDRSQPHGLRGCRFLDSGRLLTWGGDRGAVEWDLKTRKGEKTWEWPDEPGVATAVAISPDRESLLVGSPGSPIVYIDLSSREVRRRFKWAEQPGQVHALEFSPAGDAFLVAGRAPDLSTVSIISLESGEPIRTLGSLGKIVRRASFVMGGEWVVTGTHAGTGIGGPEVRTWEVSSGESLRVWTAPQSGVNCMAVHPRGDLVAFGTNGCNLFLIDLRSTGKVLKLAGEGAHPPEMPWKSQAHMGPVRGVAFGPSGDLLYSVSGTTDEQWDDPSLNEVRVWDVSEPSFSKESENLELSGRRITSRPHALMDVSVSEDGLRMALITAGGQVELWDLRP